jgi:hypothetical protein
VAPTYGIDLSKGNILMLEQLLGAESSMSVARLKRRVGLLPPIRAPRPHATAHLHAGGGGGGGSPPAAAATAAAAGPAAGTRTARDGGSS